MGGDGGGEIKKSLSDFGSARCWSDGFRGVFMPK
jgi:hypothetical protein